MGGRRKEEVGRKEGREEERGRLKEADYFSKDIFSWVLKNEKELVF